MIELFLIGFVGVLLPGPDMLLVITTTLYYGTKKALITLLGILTGNIIYIIPVLLGSYLIFYEFIPWIMILGGLYLIYIGWFIFTSRKQTIKEFDDINKTKTKNFYFKGLLTNLSNPKAMLYFASILLPSILKYDKSYIMIFFLGVILAFLMLIISSKSMIVLLKHTKYFYYSNFLFSFIFIFYGLYLFLNGINEISK